MSISADIKLIENNPINFSQIQNIVHPSIKREMVMRELDKLPENCQTKHIFGGKKFCCLFCDRHVHGKVVASHWVCLIHQNNKFIFWDSLGHTPLSLTHILQSPRHGFLKWAQKNNISSSTTRFQNKDLFDCGDFVAVRLTKHDLSNKQFLKWMRSFHIAPDKVVSLMVLPSLLPGIPMN